MKSISISITVAAIGLASVSWFTGQVAPPLAASISGPVAGHKAATEINVQADAASEVGPQATPQSIRVPAIITVDLRRRHVLGDASELDRSKFFNVHSNYTSAALTEADLEQLRELNVGFGRAFDGPFAAHQNGTPYPDTESIRDRAAAVIAATRNDPLYRYRTTRRIMTNSVEDVFNLEDDPAEMARYAADVLEFHYEDDTRPDFYAPMSIPFVAAGQYGDDPAAVRARMVEVFAAIGREFDRRDLSTQVIGYTSAWPMMHYGDFSHWRERMQLFMDVAGPHVDGICFLMLDATHMQQADRRRSGSRVEALLDLIETYGASQWGTPKPHAISEYGDVSHGWPEGDTYSPARSSAELNSYNHFLFTLLGREDRLLIAVPFLTAKSPWFYAQPRNQWQPFSADLWRPDPESIVEGQPTRFLETEKMEFYRLWREVKGHRAVANSTDPDVVAYAFTDDADAFVCLNNFEDESRAVALHFLSELPEIESVSIKRMSVPRQQAVIYIKRQLDALPATLIMEPHETIILRVTYAAPLVPSSIVRTSSYYSPDFLQPIMADQALSFGIQGVETGEANDGSTATLRVGFSREHDLSKQPRLLVNGNEVVFPDDWLGDDQANQDQAQNQGFFGSIAVPLPAGFLRGDNDITLIFPDDGGRVSTVVLEVHRVEPE